MKHPYFHRAVMSAYDQVLPSDYIPSYFIYFEVPTESIDVNIHPTKTEIKFEDEQAWWKLIKAAVREALGKFNIIPSIDFETGGIIDIPVGKPQEIKTPQVNLDFDYNPFDDEKSEFEQKRTYTPSSGHSKKPDENWERLYETLKTETLPSDINGRAEVKKMFSEDGQQNRLIQLKQKYILSPVKSGMMIIDQKRAHERILFEKYLSAFEKDKGIAQQQLFPEQMELSTEDYLLLEDILNDLVVLGFDIRNFGKNTIVINGCPADMRGHGAKDIIHAFIHEYRQTGNDIKAGAKEKLAASLAVASAVEYGRALDSSEMQEIVDSLFACRDHKYSPSGKVIVNIFGIEEIEKMFKRII
jgi:DNA mismatch repair protein MutL